jgi:hypothetical protein
MPSARVLKLLTTAGSEFVASLLVGRLQLPIVVIADC